MSFLVKNPWETLLTVHFYPRPSTATLDVHPQNLLSTLDFEPSTLDPRLLATLLIWYYPIDLSIQIFQLINVFPSYVKTIATQRSTTYLSVLHP